MTPTTTRLGRCEVTIAGHHLTLAGRIDEGSQLGELVAKLPAGDVVIDTDQVTFVNSVGMREWLRLVRGLRGRGRVTLEHVADMLMTQMNLIPEFATSVTITSFHAQYVCPQCGAEAAPVVDAIAHADALRRMQVPKLPCPECNAGMELGDFPERYLLVFRG